MEIIKLIKDYESKYTDYISTHSKSLFYYQLKYRDFLKELLTCDDDYYILLENEEIKAVLPMLYKDGKYGRVYNSLAYYGANGSILAENDLYYNKLLEKYNEIIEKSAVSTYIENPLDIHLKKPNYDFISERVCLINNLTDIRDEVGLMNQFSSVRRRNVRKAIKEDISVEIGNSDSDIDFLYKIHNENMSAIGGKIKSIEFFQKIKKYFLENKDFNIYIAKYEGEPIGALLVFYFNNIVEYYTPVIIDEFRNKQPLALLIMESMKDAVSKEFLYFNWGGNGLGLSSVYDFKKKWGAEDYKYNYYIKVNNKEILYSNPEELSKYYDNFFVVPFDELKNESCEDEK